VSHSAQVHSIDALARFRKALQLFQDEAVHALIGLEEQVRRAVQWLEHDGPVYWRAQIRQCYDEVARTRTSLETARMRTVADHRPACQEEIAAYRAAQRKLHEAEHKLESLRRWTERVRQEFDEYRGRVMNFRTAVENGVPRSLSLLGRTIASLEAYAAPTTTSSTTTKYQEPASPVATPGDTQESRAAAAAAAATTPPAPVSTPPESS
jgi:predicted RNase H-like nuclease (RuvC/YqgF family)